jgi:hypothetical protein
MAIIPNIPGLKVEIASDHHLCSEYADPGDDAPASLDTKTATNYAEIKLNSLFQIRTHICPTYPHPDFDIGACICIGGEWVAHRMFRRGQDFLTGKCATLIVGESLFTPSDGQVMARKFKFHGVTIGKPSLFVVIFPTNVVS